MRWKDTALSVMKEFAKFLWEAEMSAEAGRLESRIKEYRTDKLQIALIGTFDAGKTTLLNALARKKLFRARVNPDTAVITKIVNGVDNGVFITWKNRKIPRKRMEQEDFFQTYHTISGGRELFSEIDYVTFFSKLPWSDVILVDTPGLQHTDVDEHVTREFLFCADVIIFVMNAAYLFNQKEKEYIRENFIGMQRKNVFFAVNWCNLIPPSDLPNIEKRIQEELWEVFTDSDGRFDESLYRKRVFMLDAYLSECARTDTLMCRRKGTKTVFVQISSDDDQYSGVPELETALQVFLFSDEPIRESLRSCLPQMKQMLYTALMSLNEQKKMLTLSGEKLEKHLGKVNQELDEVRKSVCRINQAFDITHKQLLMDLVREYDEFVWKVEAGWEKYFSQKSIPFGMVEQGKIALLKVKYGLDDASHRINHISVEENERIARDEKFREIMAPVSQAVGEYIRQHAEKMAASISQKTRDRVRQLLERLTECCGNLKELEIENIEYGNIAEIFAETGDIEIQLAGQGIRPKQMFLSILLFQNTTLAYDTMFTNLTEEEFVLEGIYRKIYNVCVTIIISCLTGSFLYYLFARATYRLIRREQKAEQMGMEIVMASKDETINALKKAGVTFKEEMEKEIAEKINQDKDNFVEGLLNQIVQKERTLKKLIEQKLKQEIEVETELLRLGKIGEDLKKTWVQLEELFS